MSIDPASPPAASWVVDSDSVAVAPLVVFSAQLLTSVIGSATTDSLPTATEAVALTPSAVAVTVARPAPVAAAVNRPPPVMLPSDDGVTLQVTSRSPSVSVPPPRAVPDTANCWVALFSRSGSAGLTLRLAGALATVSGTRERARPDTAVSQPCPACFAVRLVPVTVARPGGCTETVAAPAAGLPSASVAY